MSRYPLARLPEQLVGVPMVLSAGQLLARAADSGCGSRASGRKNRVICTSGTPVRTAIGVISKSNEFRYSYSPCVSTVSIDDT